MSTPNPFTAAASPAIIAVLQAVKQLIVNTGADPLQVAVKFPGALQIFLGSVQLQLPAVAQSEFGVLQGEINTKIDTLIASLQGKAATITTAVA
jgi:hypothetical protein